MLLRPNVLVAARHSLLSSVPAPIPSHTEITLQNEVSTLCIQAAVSVIEMLHANLRSASRIISSNAVFVTLSAATVIVAASLLPGLDVNLEGGSGPYGDIIEKAFQVLHEHQWQIEGALRARYQLEKFIRTVKQAKEQRSDGIVHPTVSYFGLLVSEHQNLRETPNESVSHVANQTFDFSFQSEGDQLLFSGENAIEGIHFSDPLRDFQWDGAFP